VSAQGVYMGIAGRSAQLVMAVPDRWVLAAWSQRSVHGGEESRRPTCIPVSEGDRRGRGG
jgi:hypothetical protein